MLFNTFLALSINTLNSSVKLSGICSIILVRTSAVNNEFWLFVLNNNCLLTWELSTLLVVLELFKSVIANTSLVILVSNNLLISLLFSTDSNSDKSLEGIFWKSISSSK